jgi:hypothetical protein
MLEIIMLKWITYKHELLQTMFALLFKSWGWYAASQFVLRIVWFFCRSLEFNGKGIVRCINISKNGILAVLSWWLSVITCFLGGAATENLQKFSGINITNYSDFYWGRTLAQRLSCFFRDHRFGFELQREPLYNMQKEGYVRMWFSLPTPARRGALDTLLGFVLFYNNFY